MGITRKVDNNLYMKNYDPQVYCHIKFVIMPGCLQLLKLNCTFAATYYCITKYIRMKDEPANQLNGTLNFTTNLDYYWNLAYTWLVFG